MKHLPPRFRKKLIPPGTQCPTQEPLQAQLCTLMVRLRKILVSHVTYAPSDPNGYMMWIFHPDIAEVRKMYNIFVRFLTVEGEVSLQRRVAKILRTDTPETLPLSPLEPATVEMEYTDNKARLTRKRMRVDVLEHLHPRNGCKLLVFEGDKKGTIVRHSRTVKEKVMVKPLAGGKGFSLPKMTVCPVDDES